MMMSMMLIVLGLLPATIPDGSWLLTYSGKPVNAATADRRMLAVLRDRVPATLVGRVVTSLDRSSATVAIVDGRFVAMTGCGARDCRSTAFLWIDAKGTDAIGAAYEWVSDRAVLTVGSKGVSASELQGPALASIVSWLAQNGMEPEVVEFVGPSNTPRSIDVERFRTQSRK